MASAEEQELRDKIGNLCLARYGNKSSASMKALFESYDASGDKCLMASELSDMFSDAGIGNWLTRGTWVSRTVEALDKNPVNACVSWEEYLAATTKGEPAPPTAAPSPSTTTPTTTTPAALPPPSSDPSCNPTTGICLEKSSSAESLLSPPVNALATGATAVAFGLSWPLSLGLAGVAYVLSPK